MDNKDLYLAKQRSDEDKQKHRNIYEGEIWVHNERLKFKPCKLFQDKLTIMLPDSYTDMPIEVAKYKYPMEKRPAIIKTNRDTTINFAFSLYVVPFTVEDIDSSIKQLHGMIHNLNPSYVFHRNESMPLHRGKVGFFDFTTPGMDEQLYQLFAFTPIDNCMLQFIFNSPARLRFEWSEIVDQVLQSIEDTTYVHVGGQ